MSAFNLGIDAASCGLPKEAGYAIDAGLLPAASVEIRTVVRFIFRGPPGRGMQRISRPPQADSRVARWTIAPSSDDLHDPCAIDRRATA